MHHRPPKNRLLMRLFLGKLITQESQRNENRVRGGIIVREVSDEKWFRASAGFRPTMCHHAPGQNPALLPTLSQHGDGFYRPVCELNSLDKISRKCEVNPRQKLLSRCYERRSEPAHQSGRL